MPQTTSARDEEAHFLASALELDVSLVQPRSREPLGAGTVAGFEVAGDEASAPLLYFVDTSRYAVAAETGLALGGPAAPDARVWLHPADPHLPALAATAFGRAAETLLGRLGLTVTGPPFLVAYRPGRRAVVRVATATGDAWVKVVRPSRVERIVDAHTRLAAGGVPLPAVRGWSPDGLIVLDEASGTPAPEGGWTPEQLLDEVEGLRGAFARVTLGTRNRSVGERLSWYADRAVAASVIEPDVAARLRADIEALLSREPARPARTVHGDLHFGQLFVGEGGGISAVIDVDTAGLGSASEDEAALISHAVASALVSELPLHRERAWSLADRAHERWGRDAGTRALTAVHLLGHAIASTGRSDRERAATLVSAARAAVAGERPSSVESKGARINYCSCWGGVCSSIRRATHS